MGETPFPRTPSLQAIKNEKGNQTVAIIGSVDEFDRDWDWFAVDPDGALGHFTTAGKRTLPKSVKGDRDAALRLIEYFLENAPKPSSFLIRAEAEADAGGWNDEHARTRYLRDFTKMASAGLFSYDTSSLATTGSYFLVASPTNPARLDDLPQEIRKLVSRTRSPYSFGKSSAYIVAEKTVDW